MYTSARHTVIRIATILLFSCLLFSSLHVYYSSQQAPICTAHCSLVPRSVLEWVLVTLSHFCLLQEMYKCLYPSLEMVSTTQFFGQLRQIECCGERFLSVSPSREGSIIMAFWECDIHVCCTSCPSTLCVGMIQYLFCHTASFVVEDSQKEVDHYLAFVRWFTPHKFSNWFGDPVTTFFTHIFSTVDKACFIPLKRIVCACASMHTSMCFVSNVSEVLLLLYHLGSE